MIDLVPGTAPLSPAEVAVLEAELQVAVVDPALKIRWNSRSYITSPGCFDVYGNAIRPTYAGRWEVGKVKNDEWLSIYQVRWEGEPGEPFRQLGRWLVEKFRLMDRQNLHWIEDLRRRNAEEERIRASVATDEESALREFLDRQAFAFSSDTWNVPKRFRHHKHEEFVHG